MENPNIPTIETRIIEDDNSSWSDLSDTEKAADEPKIQQKQVHQPQAPAPAETHEQRLARLKVSEQDLNSLYYVGSIDSMTANDIIVRPGKELLNIDNVLFVKVDDKPVVLGEIDDVFGVIDAPLYCVKMDEYLRQLRPYLQASGEQIKVYVIKKNATFLDDDEIQSMRLDRGTDACHQSEMDYESSGDDEDIAGNRSVQNDYFAKRNRSPFANGNFQKKVKHSPFGADASHFHNQQSYAQRQQLQQQQQSTPGNMLLNYLQPVRQAMPEFSMQYSGAHFHNPQYAPYPQYGHMPPQFMPQQQWNPAYPYAQPQHGMHYPQQPHVQSQPPQAMNPAQQMQQQPQQQGNKQPNGSVNSFFYQ